MRATCVRPCGGPVSTFASRCDSSNEPDCAIAAAAFMIAAPPGTPPSALYSACAAGCMFCGLTVFMSCDMLIAWLMLTAGPAPMSRARCTVCLMRGRTWCAIRFWFTST